jgi:ribosome-associated protein
MTQEPLLIEKIQAALEDLKALEILTIDVKNRNSIIDYMMIASGTSARHVQSVAENLVEKLKEQGIRPRGINGDTEGEWWLVDMGDVIVHVMHPKTRALYNLEELWDSTYARRQESISS